MICEGNKSARIARSSCDQDTKPTWEQKLDIPKTILRPTVSGSQTRRIFFPMSMTCRERSS